MKYLVTGGAGYIGSHTCLRLLEQGADITVLDNLSNSTQASLDRIAAICDRRASFINGDVCDPTTVDRVVRDNDFDGVIHFAGLKAVGESTEQPLRYFRNNVTGTVNLLEAMKASNVKTLVFSSSATVYGTPDLVPIVETAALSVTNPYGRSKLMVEEILADVYAADPSWRIAKLRYFNPVGAHPSGLIGEDPLGIPNNLMPFICQVAAGRRDRLAVFGGDYPTRDGTGVRDYIHVQDLAEGHLAALRYLAEQKAGAQVTVNLGTGQGFSVLEMIRSFERVTGRPIPYDIVARRPGDVAACYADPTLAKSLLRWRTEHNVNDMCRDAWRWQSENPRGY